MYAGHFFCTCNFVANICHTRQRLGKWPRNEKKKKSIKYQTFCNISDMIDVLTVFKIKVDYFLNEVHFLATIKEDIITLL